MAAAAESSVKKMIDLKNPLSRGVWKKISLAQTLQHLDFSLSLYIRICIGIIYLYMLPTSCTQPRDRVSLRQSLLHGGRLGESAS